MHAVSFDNRWSLFSRGRTHLAFESGGKRIAYAYIRKNGCSAFKGMLCGDPHVGVGELKRRFPFRSGRYDAVIFVWRDPLERLVSLYRNKVIERQNAEDILGAYRVTMGAEPGSFDDFVRFACTEADPHCHTQASHLKRLRYTHAIPLKRLHETMRELIGRAADKHFTAPVNRTDPHPVEVSAEAAATIKKHYADDYRMITRLNRAH